METTFYPSFYLFIITQGFFFFLLIVFTSHGRPLAKKLLLAFIAVQMISPFLNYLSLSSDPLYLTVRYLGDVNYLSGPIIYFYIKALRSPGFCFGLQQLAHFIPPLIAGLCLRFLFMHSLEEPVMKPDDIWSVRNLILMTWFLAYLIASLGLLPASHYSLREWVECKENTIWRWLFVPILFYIAAYLLTIFTYVTHLLSVFDSKFGAGLSLAMSCRIVFFYMLAIGGYRHRYTYEIQAETIQDDDIEENTTTLQEEGKAKYANSALGEEHLNALWRDLNDYMNREEPFLDTGLKLSDLAGKMAIPANNLSQVINRCSHQSFHDFINGYRAHKAHALIQSHADTDKPLLDLSLEAGFGNTATFYKYFKKHYATTPAQYRRSCLG